MKSVREYLKLTGLTQAELAKRAKIDASQLNHFLSGKRQPSVKNIRKLSAVTGITIENLVKEI